jgi:tetrapyrrole methylase family protein / MazG family protein
MESYPHLKSAPKNEAEWFGALAALARYLRGPSGCPWDRKRHSSDFAGYLQEEAQELADAYADPPDNDNIEEELGDCLFTLLASAAAAEEEGRYTLEDALRRIHEKMIRRHGHVFGGPEAATPEDAMAAWERVKAEEKRRKAKE